MWEPRYLTTLWASTACYRESFFFYLHALGRIFESRRKRTEVERGRIKENFMCTEEPLNLYSSPNIIIGIKPSNVAYVGYIARVGQIRNAYRILI
jgi:hypothetical protein